MKQFAGKQILKQIAIKGGHALRKGVAIENNIKLRLKSVCKSKEKLPRNFWTGGTGSI